VSRRTEASPRCELPLSRTGEDAPSRAVRLGGHDLLDESPEARVPTVDVDDGAATDPPMHFSSRSYLLVVPTAGSVPQASIRPEMNADWTGWSLRPSRATGVRSDDCHIGVDRVSHRGHARFSAGRGTEWLLAPGRPRKDEVWPLGFTIGSRRRTQWSASRPGIGPAISPFAACPP
jgi:hypothetical protein